MPGRQPYPTRHYGCCSRLELLLSCALFHIYIYIYTQLAALSVAILAQAIRLEGLRSTCIVWCCVFVTMGDPWLAEALETIEATGKVGRERKRLLDSAFRTSRGGGGSCGGCHEAVSKRQCILDGTGMSITKLKASLRRRGFSCMASRLGKLSSERNQDAHPLTLEAVMAALAEAPCGSDGSDGGIGSSGTGSSGRASTGRIDGIETRLSHIEAYLRSIPVCVVPMEPAAVRQHYNIFLGF